MGWVAIKTYYPIGFCDQRLREVLNTDIINCISTYAARTSNLPSQKIDIIRDSGNQINNLYLKNGICLCPNFISSDRVQA